jgi:hypothetical protein
MEVEQSGTRLRREDLVQRREKLVSEIGVKISVRIAKLQSYSLRKRFIPVGVGSVYSIEPRKIEND